MQRFYSYKLGEYAGHEYVLSVNGEPSLDDIEEFAVTIHYTDPRTSEETEIARIDTSHGYVHFDKIFREEQPKEALDIDEYWEAEERLRENWLRYARRYESNHR